LDLHYFPQRFNAAAHFVDRNLEEGRGSKVAFECGDRQVTYGQFGERVNRTGNALHELGVRTEQRVVLLLLDGPEFAYSFFGAIKIGAVPVPVNTLLKPPEWEFILDDSRARVAIISEALLPQFLQTRRESLRHLDVVIVAGAPAPGTLSLAEVMAASSAELAPEPTGKDDVAFWLYSSGSTGPPKGCVHLQHDMVVCAERYAKNILGMREDDRCFSVAKLFFAYGLGNALYFPLAVGATSILWPGSPAPAKVYGMIEQHRPTLFFSVPSNFALLLAQRQPEGRADFDLSSVRYAISAGEALPAALYHRFRQRFGVEILDAIGSTECLHMFIANRPGEARPGSSGQIIPGFEARIVDEKGEPVPTGEIGNLLIKSDATCAHYWKQHEKTKEIIQGHWIKTGDKYRVDDDGYYWYAGRSDDMLKASGVWVSPVEIENVLIEHPAVAEAAVVGREDGDNLIKPAAYVVLCDSAHGSNELSRELQEFVAAKLASYKRPRWVEFVAELPKTATGKIQRFKLRQ
jgi:benzoate-CoA ligase family protein